MSRVGPDSVGHRMTLTRAHDLLSRELPGRDAAPEVWLAYYRRSAAVYAEVAETDRGHHHEAMYWSSRERRRADEIAQRLTRAR